MTGPITIRNLLDTHVGEDQPLTNYNLGGSLYVRNWATTGRLAYLYATRPFPLGVTIVSAKLHLYAYAKPVAGSITMYLRMLNQTVTYGKVNWNTRPTALLTSIAERTSVQAGTYPDRTDFEFDITAHMQAISDGTKWYGWQLRTNWTMETFSPRFMSVNHPNPDLRPWVEVTWSDKPDQPTQLSPAGNRYVSNDQPVLRFDYTDVSGDTDLAQIRVQIDNAADFVTPLYDSMDQPVDSPQWDLEGSAFTMAADTTYYWRVMVQDGAGLWSSWSAGAQFRYHALPTVEFDSPAAPPNNFVEEPTPPITWTVTGGTQAAYSLDLYRKVSGKWSPVFHRGRTASTVADGFKVPAGVITVKDATYLADLRIWDALDREAVPSGQVYRLRSREFTYEFSALTTPVNTLAADPADPYPGIALTWQRATMPDSYSIIRDGLVIAADLDPDNDTWVSGTSYAWTDRFPIKGRAHVYSVQPIVNGKASTANPTVTATNRILGTWLVGAAEDGWQVCIVNDKGRTFELTEDSAIYDVLGATTRALVTQTLRGYSGEVTGTLMAQVGGTSESAGTWRNHLLELKAVAGQLVYLFITDMTTPVVLQNVQCHPSVNSVRSYEASFTWHQQELPVGFSPKGLL